jgi:hypothetical protein
VAQPVTSARRVLLVGRGEQHADCAAGDRGAAVAALTGSPSTRSPKIAIWISSVFEYATPSAKLRSCMTRSRNAVAAIWLTAPSVTQA